MEIRRTESGDIQFFDDNGDIYEVIYKDRLNFDDINYFMKQDRHFVEHPMCRCSITPMEAKIMISMPYISKVLVKEYVGECKESKIWRN